MENSESVYFVRAFVRAWETGSIALWNITEVEWAKRILAAVDNNPPNNRLELTPIAGDGATVPPNLEGIAMNIVNAILEEAGTDVDTRQRINDDCGRFVIELLETLTSQDG